VEIVGSNRACKGNNGEGADFNASSKNRSIEDAAVTWNFGVRYAFPSLF